MQKTSDLDALHHRGKNDASAGCFVMTKNGDLILLHPSAFGELKEGQRLATQDDIDRKAAEEAARREPEVRHASGGVELPAPEPEPTTPAWADSSELELGRRPSDD